MARTNVKSQHSKYSPGRGWDNLTKKEDTEMKIRGVFPVGILLILLSGGSSSFAQKYKRDIAEYKGRRSTRK
jgi:hypothetical protein